LLNNELLVGVIQTSLDYKAAWVDDKTGMWKECVRISAIEERRARKEIRHHLASLRGLDQRPHIVLLPELAVPLGFERKLTKAAEKLESIVIAGMDYRIANQVDPTVSNEAIVIVPRVLNGIRIARRTDTRRVGKTYAAPGEEKSLKGISGGGVKFHPQPTIWLFSSKELGSFAVAVCYDFLDLDRIVLYRNRIQTLFVLAYNRDITSFDHMAEAIARTVFCNVVICNCGYYGGSIAVSPFRKPFRRIVYRHSGQNLPNAQLIGLPLSELKEHQEKAPCHNDLFKSLPPGFDKLVPLSTHVEKV
jgi:predicted amidohydrolase